MHNSDEFKEVAKKAQPFFHALKDFAFGKDLTLENAVCDDRLCLVSATAGSSSSSSSCCSP